MLAHGIGRPAAYLHRVGALIESPAFYPTLTGAADREVFARLGGHDRGRIAELLEIVGLGWFILAALTITATVLAGRSVTSCVERRPQHARSA